MRRFAASIALGLSLFAFAVDARAACDRESDPSCSPPPSELPRWDSTKLLFATDWRLGSSIHASTLPRVISICEPRGKTCSPVSALPSSAFGSQHLQATSVDFGGDILGLGPLRLGLDMNIGPGSGPSTMPGATPRVAGGWLYSAGFLTASFRFRGDHWVGYTELRGGFTTYDGDVHGTTMDDRLTASANGYVLGARVGGGVFLTRWLTVSAFAGGGAGEMTEIDGGVRFELRMEDLIHQLQTF